MKRGPFPYFVRARDPVSRLLALIGIKRYVITETGLHELNKLGERLAADDDESE